MLDDDTDYYRQHNMIFKVFQQGFILEFEDSVSVSSV